MASATAVDAQLDIPYGALPAQKLDVYIPQPSDSDSSATAKALVCFVHGGAWRAEDKSDHRELAVRLAQRTGCAVAVPNYRLTPNTPTPETALQHPVHAEDVLAALEFFVRPTPSGEEQPSSPTAGSAGVDLQLDPQTLPPRADSSHPKLNPDAIFVIGHSCSAHILTAFLLDSSAVTPTLSPSSALRNAVRGVALSEGIYDIDLLLQSFPSYKGWFIANTFGDKPSYSSDSTTTYPRRANDGDPAWLIIHSLGDTLVDIAQSHAIHKHLESLDFAATKDFETIKFDHNDMLKTSQYTDLVGDFFKELIKSKQQ